MKNGLFLIFSIFLLLIFLIFEIHNRNFYYVIEIKEPDVIGVDFNRNGVVDNGEHVCVANVKSYKSNTDNVQNIKLWYLANNFAERTLENKQVKVKLTKENTPECVYGNIFVDGHDYAKLLAENNFDLLNQDKDKLEEQLKFVDKLSLVIYNHKSNIYHELECKYGQIAHDIKILAKNQLSKDAKPCKFCHNNEIRKSKKFDFDENIKMVSYKTFPLMITDEKIKLILSDFTLKLKPDSSCSSLMCKSFLEEINNSKESIDIALYEMSDNSKVIDALKLAIKRGVKIRIVYDVTENGISSYSQGTQKLLDIVGKDNARSDYSGIKSQSKLLMHNKFVIFDRKTVFTGSMNFSNNGLSGYNNNNIVVINSPNVAKAYSWEFEQMFSGKFHTAKLPKKFNQDENLRVYFSPQDKTISRQIVPIINSAQKYIYLPVFVLTHDELCKALLNAQNRGVDVRIIVDAANVSARHSKIKLLRDNGIPVKTENYAGKLHNKTIAIDDKYLIIGSMNFSNSGENKNDENCVIIQNNKLARFYKDYFLYLWQKIPDKYLKINPSAEGSLSIGSCFDGVDNDFDGKIDAEDEGCRVKEAK